MKKSEFIEETKKRAREWPSRAWTVYEPSKVEVIAGLSAEVAEENLGFQWDPEEPELPERIFRNPTLGGLCEMLPGGRRGLSDEELDEAAARYNFVRRLNLYKENVFDDDTYTVEYLRAVLVKEREKLK